MHGLSKGTSALFATLLFTGCSGGMDMNAGVPGAPPPDAETPPTGGAALEAWLAQGSYKNWHCEPAVHANRSPSPHGMNRICSNALASAFSGSGERPRGTAAVKEIYDSAGTKLNGYAVYLKTQATSGGGDNWYWYERITSVNADGLGSSGCVSCHKAAGSDAAHTPSPGGSDQVYTQVH